MTADHGSEGGRQRTVAELLEQYGEGGAPPRRRRASRSESVPESGSRRSRRELREAREAEQRAVPQPRETEQPREVVGDPLWDNPYRDTGDPLGGVPSGERPFGEGPSGEGRVDGAWSDPLLWSPAAFTSSPAPSSPPASAPPREDPTEQLPRYPRPGLSFPEHYPPLDSSQVTAPIGQWPPTPPDVPAPPVPEPSVQDSGPFTAQVSHAELFGPEDEPVTDGPEVADVPAGLESDEELDLAGERRGGGITAWLALVGQWIVGAVGGAALWVGFRFLWLNVPVIALAAAVVATVGLVLLVRAIRRSDDVQTTMLAILVGLMVTISPAVLLLATR